MCAEWEAEAKADTANVAYFEVRMRDLREKLSTATEQSSGSGGPGPTGPGTGSGNGGGRSWTGSQNGGGGARPQTPSAFSSLYSSYSSSLALPAHVARTIAPNRQAALEPAWAISVCIVLYPNAPIWNFLLVCEECKCKY